MRRIATTFCLLLLGALVSSTAVAVNGIPDCEDGIDNDGDGLIDYPADPGCQSPDGTSEVNSPLDGGTDAGFDASFDVAKPTGIGDLMPGTQPPSMNGPTAVVPPPASSAERPITSGCEMGVLSEGGTLLAIVLVTLAIALVRRAHGSARRSS